MPGSPACMRNAGEFRWLIIVGSAIFGGGVWLVVCWGCCRIDGCVLVVLVEVLGGSWLVLGGH